MMICQIHLRLQGFKAIRLVRRLLGLDKRARGSSEHQMSKGENVSIFRMMRKLMKLKTRGRNVAVPEVLGTMLLGMLKFSWTVLNVSFH